MLYELQAKYGTDYPVNLLNYFPTISVFTIYQRYRRTDGRPQQYCALRSVARYKRPAPGDSVIAL